MVAKQTKLTTDQLLEMYRKMVRIRRFEDKVVAMYAEGIMPGLAHLYPGEEAVAVGACSALNADDYIVSTHRGHGHMIAKGASTDRMMAELFGKKAGYCEGKGGSMHIADLGLGVLGAMSIVGSGLPIAVGSGYSAVLRKSGQVTIAFFGDAASNTGAAHESLNMAAAWKLPVVYVCENNGFGISVPQCKHQGITDIATRAAGYGMPGVIVDGNDVLAVYEAVKVAVERARAGQGPSFIECKTYRLRGHFEGDPGRGARYRSADELACWESPEKDAIERFRAWLTTSKKASSKELAAIGEDIQAEIEAATEFAKNAPFPDVSEGKKDVYTARWAYLSDPSAPRPMAEGSRP
jgi:acetoin:2,6-dichlorophenolindophenol oxidoreductase subunit alpha